MLKNIGTQLDQFLPQLFLPLGAWITLLLLVIGSQQDQGFRTLSHLPFGKGMIQAYLTAYYAREWGNLIGQGLSCLRFFP